MRFQWRNSLAGAALAALTGLFFLWTRSGDGLLDLSYDLPFLFRGDIQTGGITILDMDLESGTRLKQLRHAAWDRAVHARLLDRLKELHAKVVVFDILFLPTTEDPAADRRLVESAKSFGNVVVAAKPAQEVLNGEVMGQPLMKPFPDLADVTSWGVVEAPRLTEAQKSIRKHYCREDYGYDAPCLASRAAGIAQSNAPPEQPGPRWINYYGPPGTIRHHSYYKIFETNQIPLAHISNQVVFVGGLYDIGFSGGRSSDDFRTPYTRRTGGLTAGVEVGATAYLNLIHDHWLRRPRPGAEAALVALSGIILGLALAAVRPIPATMIALIGALAIAGAGIWIVWQTHIWLPWMIPVAIQIPCALGWSILVHTKKLAREKHSLEQALALASEGKVGPDRDGAREQPAPVGIGSSARSSAAPAGVPQTPPIPGGQPTRASIPDHELLRCIGKGAYGEVWLARDAIGTFHAVKIVYRSAFPDAIPLEREFNGIRKFTPISRSHPGFVHILHVGRNEADGYIFYVMELGDDEATGQTIDPQTYRPLTLASLMERRGRLPLEDCLALCIQLADALDYLHRQQLIHRDIKPSNIIFVKGVPKFADVGLVTDVATKGRDVTYLGTPGRIAPEGPGSPASDVYSLGKIIYETGLGLDLTRFPELPTELVRSDDETGLFQLNRIILKACEPDLRHRHPSAAALRDDLIALQKSTRGEGRPDSAMG